jgi:hypothetical protein
MMRFSGHARDKGTHFEHTGKCTPEMMTPSPSALTATRCCPYDVKRPTEKRKDAIILHDSQHARNGTYPRLVPLSCSSLSP